jgi:hypothetical protein
VRDGHRDSDGIEVTAVVADDDRRPRSGNVLDAADAELGIREQQRMHEAEREALQLEVHHRDLGHAGTGPERD